jgi:hypothetical protein
LRWAFQFWKTCAGEKVNIAALAYIADKLQQHQNQSMHHFHVLLELFPSSIPILRSYAAFVLDCSNQQRLGEEIIDFADRLEEEKHERIAHPENNMKSSQSALDDSRMDRSSESGSNTGKGGSGINSLVESKSIFDIESYEEQRNGVALKNVKRLTLAIRFSLLILFAAIIFLYFGGVGFLQAEVQDRLYMREIGECVLIVVVPFVLYH